MTRNPLSVARGTAQKDAWRLEFPVRPIVVFAVLVLAPLAPAPAAGQGMKLLTPTTGWVARANHLYWTADGGSDWKDITPVPAGLGPGGVTLHSVFFLDSSEGWAVISYAEAVVPLTLEGLRTRKTLYDIAQTVDGGRSWSFMPFTYPELPNGQGNALAGPADIYFLDSMRGWMVMALSGSSNFAPGRLLATDDGGNSWSWVNSPWVTGALRFTTARDGWLVSYQGAQHLYVTHDGCKTWRELKLSPPTQVGAAVYPAYYPPVFVDPQHGFLTVSYSGAEGTPSKLVVYSTDDGGRAWKAAKILAESWDGGDLPIAVTRSALIVPSGSDIGRVTTATVPLAGSLGSSVVVSRIGTQALTFADSLDGWALTGDFKLMATTDGGATWHDITPWRTIKPAVQPPTPAKMPGFRTSWPPVLKGPAPRTPLPSKPPDAKVTLRYCASPSRSAPL